MGGRPMSARIPVALAFFSLSILAGATNSQAAPSAVDRAHDVTLAQSPSERARSVSGVAPVLTAPAPMTLPGGTTADQVLHATDGDGDPITFSKSFGPAYMTVTTIDPDSGSATGNVHLAPSLADVGPQTGGIAASDGVLTSAQTLSITVTGPDRPPVLAQPQPMSGRAGETIDQELTATDPDGDLLSFVKVSDPAYMSVQTIEAAGSGATGLVRLATTAQDSGSTTATVGASDGQLMDQKSFAITIRANASPVIDYIPTLVLSAGSTLDRSVYASDADGAGVRDRLGLRLRGGDGDHSSYPWAGRRGVGLRHDPGDGLRAGRHEIVHDQCPRRELSTSLRRGGFHPRHDQLRVWHDRGPDGGSERGCRAGPGRRDAGTKPPLGGAGVGGRHIWSPHRSAGDERPCFRRHRGFQPGRDSGHRNPEF